MDGVFAAFWAKKGIMRCPGGCARGAGYGRVLNAIPVFTRRLILRHGAKNDTVHPVFVSCGLATIRPNDATNTSKATTL